MSGRAVDVALAAVLGCVAQAEVWTVDDVEGPRALVALAALAMTLPALWRRRAPLAVATVVMAALAVSCSRGIRRTRPSSRPPRSCSRCTPSPRTPSSAGR